MTRLVDRCRRSARAAGAALLTWASLWGCAGSDGPAADPDPVAAAVEAGWHVDSVGVRTLAEGDTLNEDAGLTAIETTVIFPPNSKGGEVFAWEFEARTLNPVKLLIVHAIDGRKTFEIIGESPMVVPRRLGPNRFELPEPIPLKYPSLFGFYSPENGTIPFRKIHNWRMLIAQRPLTRPFIDRAPFAMYGWRYCLRVFWRKPVASAASAG